MRKMGLLWVILSFLAGFPLANAQEAAPTVFAVTTTAVLDEGALPVLYTCDGKDISPQLSWTNPPAKTQSFAIIVSDSDAPNGVWYHWLVYNIPKDAKEMTEGMLILPKGAAIGQNSWGKNAYNGPCPPKNTAHTYILTLYALNTVLKLPTNADAKSLLAAMQGHILGTAKLSAVYSRWLH